MALKTLVKLSKVNNLSDARYGAGMGVALMGFNFSSKEGEVMTKENFADITGWISGVELVAEFTVETMDEIHSLLEGVEVQYVQTENTDVLAQAQSLQIPVIYKVRHLIDIDSVEDQLAQHIAYLLWESDDSLSEDDLSMIASLASRLPLLVGTGVDLSNLDRLLDTQIAGIALQGGEEIRPGFKDFDELSDILEQLETD